jgi:alpha/beta superfamily hydrolase
LFIDGPAGRIEALLEKPGQDPPAGLVVISHPHPAYGGTMQNKVVHTLSRAFLAQQFVALRFNFRGVGQSAGSYDEAEGEFQDLLAAIDWMTDRFSETPLWLAGFSFGGAMAIRAAVKTPTAGLVSVAPAITRFANELNEPPTCPWLIVQGDKDELVDINETIDYVNSLDPGPRLSVFSDGEHFFHGRLVELRETVAEFVGANL